MALFPSNFSFPILTAPGNSNSGVTVDFADMFVRKELFYDGGLWACGYNNDGQLGNNTTIYYSSPIQIGSLTNWKQVASGNHNAYGQTFQFSMGIQTNGTLWTWGYGPSGQFGTGLSSGYYSSPIQVGSLNSWRQISTKGGFWLALKNDSTVWGCGINYGGQLGNGTTGTQYSSPIQVGSSANWKAVAAGSQSTLLLSNNGSLWGCGYNTYGTLGLGTTVGASSPVQIGSLTTWNYVSVGNLHTAAIKTDGTLWMWGYNVEGELAQNNTTGTSSPVQVGTQTNWKQVACGNSHVLAIKTDGTLWSWGLNTSGQLGNGSVSSYSSPIQVGSLNNWKYVSTAGNASGAIKTDGTLWMWGQNTNGNLGNNAITNISSPIQIGTKNNWKSLSPGSNFSLFISVLELPI